MIIRISDDIVGEKLQDEIKIQSALWCLRQVNFNMSKAYKLLGVSYRTLRFWRKKYPEIEKEFKSEAKTEKEKWGFPRGLMSHLKKKTFEEVKESKFYKYTNDALRDSIRKFYGVIDV